MDITKFTSLISTYHHSFLCFTLLKQSTYQRNHVMKNHRALECIICYAQHKSRRQGDSFHEVQKHQYRQHCHKCVKCKTIVVNERRKITFHECRNASSTYIQICPSLRSFPSAIQISAIMFRNISQHIDELLAL